ncbi:HpcH/HpaI aldolase family protein [Ramlibacter sp.]|uniref:HpcH/HpaI aldolase family protein n=1 Tax=Ramlibacter sp. TaxID=1917967 RepID=UPI003D13A0E2
MSRATTLTNPAKDTLAAGGFVRCLTLRHLVGADAPLMIREAGFDAFYVDREHCAVSDETTSKLCIVAAAIGMTPLVRVRSLTSADIAGALDGGALGVIVPHIGTVAEAEFAVRCAKFPPLGERSVAALNPTLQYRSVPVAESMRVQNDATLVIAMLESEEGIANADAIAAIAGIDVLMIGSNDLTAQMGIAGERNHPRLRAAFEHVAQAAKRHGKHLVCGGAGPDMPWVIGLGARMLMGATDAAYFIAGAKQATAAMAAAADKTKET